MIAITLWADEMPTCTCTPQISICRPHHWVRLINSAYRGASVSFCADHFAKGCVPAQNNSMPWPRTICRAFSRVARRSSIACGVVSQIPVTISTVLRSNSLCTRGFSPISAMTVAASLLKSRVCASTSANSHSTPIVGRGEPSKPIWALALPVGPLAGTNDTARHPLTSVTGGHRRLVGAWCSVGLGVAIPRDVAEIVGSRVNHDRGPLAGQQLILGERVGRRHQQRCAVLADFQRGQVAA